MKAKKAIGKIHFWLGLSSGLVVFILGITGCILAFEYELKDLFYHQRIFTPPPHNQPMQPASQLLNVAAAALGSEYRPDNIRYYEPGRNVQVGVYQTNEQGWNMFSHIKAYKTVYVNPYTAKVVYVEDTKYEFFYLVFSLHYDLMLAGTGEKIVGWATVIFIVMLITGLVLWWPRNKAAARQRFSFKWKATTKWKRKNYDLHNILGFYALLFALLIALTGLVWAFTWFDSSVQWLANGGKHTPDWPTFQSDSTATPHAAVYDHILAHMQRQAPNEKTYYISVPATKSESVYGYAQSFNKNYKWTGFYYDQQTGKNLWLNRFKDRLPGDQLRNMNFDIHTGLILGWPGRILAFLVSFIAAGLPITGFYIWWGRKKKPSSGSGRH
ncbi:PepSY-associated TM helix domain-containing protein [Niabella yanshanensis]|uniref:PepSY-associated TM helix domain-containing protein n=1 Tax=Niabella yanshanensis TaxID=577386 RepID=A0ABZ0WAN5_9BACT|nr:PepSY-associated TM helix domain-containing protein [Niabella yanshanensis]WQD39210.1 PepSY-associated TM helix domain-containing protein [Niabella yanshanensis]